jgi:hypothetical protein
VITYMNLSLLKKEIINMLFNTFKTLYFECLVESLVQRFTNLVIVVERIEQAIKVEKKSKVHP